VSFREDRRRTFDEIAELYDQFRPGYPRQLVDDVLWLSGVPEQGRVLEIGCGTGKASVLFAERGFRMTCLEPMPNMAGIAERNLASFANARVEVSTFEAWQGETSAWDLVLAAQSFHFIDPAVGLAKAASALRAGGALVIFLNDPVRGDSKVEQRIQEAYARHAPALAHLPSESGPEDRIDKTGLFGTVVMARYPWSTVYTAADYMGLMETQSPHRLLPREQRAALLEAIHDAITDHGGSITVNYVLSLWLAKRRATARRRMPPP
jgi:SAM-dependent methyltransferase